MFGLKFFAKILGQKHFSQRRKDLFVYKLRRLYNMAAKKENVCGLETNKNSI